MHAHLIMLCSFLYLRIRAQKCRCNATLRCTALSLVLSGSVKDVKHCFSFCWLSVCSLRISLIIDLPAVAGTKWEAINEISSVPDYSIVDNDVTVDLALPRRASARYTYLYNIIQFNIICKPGCLDYWYYVRLFVHIKMALIEFMRFLFTRQSVVNENGMKS